MCAPSSSIDSFVVCPRFPRTNLLNLARYCTAMLDRLYIYLVGSNSGGNMMSRCLSHCLPSLSLFFLKNIGFDQRSRSSSRYPAAAVADAIFHDTVTTLYSAKSSRYGRILSTRKYSPIFNDLGHDLGIGRCFTLVRLPMHDTLMIYVGSGFAIR